MLVAARKTGMLEREVDNNCEGHKVTKAYHIMKSWTSKNANNLRPHHVLAS